MKHPRNPPKAIRPEQVQRRENAQKEKIASRKKQHLQAGALPSRSCEQKASRCLLTRRVVVVQRKASGKNALKECARGVSSRKEFFPPRVNKKLRQKREARQRPRKKNGAVDEGRSRACTREKRVREEEKRKKKDVQPSPSTIQRK